MKFIKLYILSIEQKKFLNKLRNILMNLKKVLFKMETIFINSENSKISDLYRLLFNLLERLFRKN